MNTISILMYEDMICNNIAHIFSQNEKQKISDHFQNRKNRDNIGSPNTYIHDRSPSWLGTGKPIISGGTNLVLKSNSWYVLACGVIISSITSTESTCPFNIAEHIFNCLFGLLIRTFLFITWQHINVLRFYPVIGVFFVIINGLK